MARFNKIQVMTAMKETGMVPVFFHSNIDICKNVIKACYDGGVRVFEFTNRGDFAHEIFGELIKWAAKECPELILGIGTVVDAPTAAIGSQLCGRSQLQSRDCSCLQSSSCSLQPRLWFGIGNQRCSGSRL